MYQLKLYRYNSLYSKKKKTDYVNIYWIGLLTYFQIPQKWLENIKILSSFLGKKEKKNSVGFQAFYVHVVLFLVYVLHRIDTSFPRCSIEKNEM